MNHQPASRLLPKIVRIFFDVLAINISMILAIHVHYLLYLFRQLDGLEFTLDYYFQKTSSELVLWLEYAPVYTIFAISIFLIFGFYNTGRFRRFRDRFFSLTVGTVLANLALLLLMHFRVEHNFFPRGITVLFFLFSYTLCALPRLMKPLVLWLAKHLSDTPVKDSRVRQVLIIGGAGYIGSVLSGLLLKKGYKVRVLDPLLFGPEAVGHLLNHKNFDLLKGDCRNIGDLAGALEEVDAVVHLAGLVGDPACAVRSDLTIDINYAATETLMQLCKAKGIARLIFASTCSVYGVGEDILTEESDLNPVSLYARTKIDSEHILLEGTTSAFQPTILRFATVFGLSPRPRFDLVVNTFAAKAVLDGKIEVFGGNQWRPFVHTYDIARAIELCLAADTRRVGGKIFNVGDDNLNFTINDIAQKTKEALPELTIVNRGDTPDPRNYKVSFSRIRETLGFECERSIEGGIREVVDAVTSSENKIDITSHAYNNHTQAQLMVASNSAMSVTRIHMADTLRDGWVKAEQEVEENERDAG